MAVRKIKNSWWVDFRFNRQRYRKRSPRNSRGGAEAYEAFLRQKLAQEGTIDTHKDTSKNRAFQDFADRWYKEYVLTNNKYSEQRSKKYILERHLLPAFGKTPIGNITTQKVEQFKARQISNGLTRKTINNHLTVLSKCLNTAKEWGELTGTPNVKWLSCPPPCTDFLTHEECAQLLTKAKGIWYELILTALRTGLRRGELRGLQWQDINWNNKTLTVRHSWCESKNGLVSPKSNRERTIPLDIEVYTALYQRRKMSGFVFANGNKRPFDAKTMSETLRHTAQEAGLRRVHWHMLRHTFASHLAMAGAPLTAIKELLGHADLTTSMRYAHLMPSTLRSAIALLRQSNGSALSPCGQPAVNQAYAVAAQFGNEKTPVHQESI